MIFSAVFRKGSLTTYWAPRWRVRVPIVFDSTIFAGALAAMAWINREWLLTGRSAVDSWMYFGYFLHYNDPDFLADNKKIARLPWILLGYLVHRLFTPIVASYVLHAGLLLAATVTLYLVVERLFTRHAAILTALVYLTAPLMQAEGGWDYHDTLTPAIYFLSFLALDAALGGSRGTFIMFVGVGVLLALTIHINVLVLLVVPALLIHAIFRIANEWPSHVRTRLILRGACGIVVGGVAVTLCLGSINLVFGRQFLFFAPLFDRSVELLANSKLERSWWLPWSNSWWFDDVEVHTAFPEAILLLAAIVLMWSLLRYLSRRGQVKPVAIAVYLEFLASVGFAAVLQTLGHPILEPDYMAFPLYLPMFVALAGLISQAVDGWAKESRLELNPRLLAILGLCAALILVAEVSVRVAVSQSFFKWLPEWQNKMPFLLTIGALAGGALIARLWPAKAKCPQGGAIVCFIWVAAILGQVNGSWRDLSKTAEAHEPGDLCIERGSILSAVVDADRILFPIASSGKRVVTWYRGDEQDGLSSSCRLATKELAKPLIAMGYAGRLHYWEIEATGGWAPASGIDDLTPGNSVLAIVSDDPAYVARVLADLRVQDPRWRELASHIVGDRDVKFGLHLMAAQMVTSPGNELPLKVVPQNGASVEALVSGAAVIRLPTNPWSYAGTLLPAKALNARAGAIVVQLRVLSGTAAIGVLKLDASDFLIRKIVTPRSEPVEVILDLADWHDAGPLLIESGEVGGGEVVVSSVAFIPKPKPASSQTH